MLMRVQTNSRDASSECDGCELGRVGVVPRVNPTRNNFQRILISFVPPSCSLSPALPRPSLLFLSVSVYCCLLTFRTLVVLPVHSFNPFIFHKALSYNNILYHNPRTTKTKTDDYPARRPIYPLRCLTLIVLFVVLAVGTGELGTGNLHRAPGSLTFRHGFFRLSAFPAHSARFKPIPQLIKRHQMLPTERRVGSSYRVPPIDLASSAGSEEDLPRMSAHATPPLPLASTKPLRVKKQKRRYPQLPTFQLPFPLEDNNNVRVKDSEDPLATVRPTSFTTRPSIPPSSNSWPSFNTPSPAAQLKSKPSPNTPSSSESRGSSVSPIVTPRRRHQDSSADNSVAFPALSLSLEPSSNQRVRFISPSQPSITSMATRDGRRSSEFSRQAATSTGSWQQQVAEQVIRLSLTPSDGSSPAPILRRTTSRRRAKQRTVSGDVTGSSAPVTSLPIPLIPKRGNASHKPVNSHDKENAIHPANDVNVRVVKQESFADVNDRIQWPFPGPEPELSFGPTRQRNPRTPTVSVSHPDYAGDSDVDEVITVIRSPPPPPSTSPSPPALSPPVTPPRRTPSSGTRAVGSLSPLSETTDDSPVPSRHRLSSYVIESSSLFFMPRSHPPSSEEAGPSSSSPPVPGPSSRFSDSETGHDPTPAPGGIRLLPRVAETVSSPPLPFVGKGKKRMSEEEEAFEYEGAPGLRPPAEQRQRVESNMTKYTDDDTIAGEH